MVQYLTNHFATRSVVKPMVALVLFTTLVGVLVIAVLLIIFIQVFIIFPTQSVQVMTIVFIHQVRVSILLRELHIVAALSLTRIEDIQQPVSTAVHHNIIDIPVTCWLLV